ncbi:MAG: UDP-N-acetylmuramoyl-tripeptide--D-alanyl-D-alanine ligase [Oscillospiraceae bacterium]|nr:UDP-N-acetylmuramoyl-tripeptide--D-alanyl-D-alanine ligase [Oscillospiraceae bacterium]
MTVAFAVLTVCYLLCAFFLFRKHVHIFQLDGYKHEVQKKWIRENLEDILLRSVWALGAVLLLRELGKWGAYLSAVLFLIVAALNLPKKAKKALVFTARVRRLAVTFLILCCIPPLLGFLAPEGEAFGALLMSFALVFAPWLLLGADTINRPVEKAVSDWYIRDARRILAQDPELKIIGVTGSYGKTSVKFFLEKLLSVQYNVLVTPLNYNTTLGVVRTVRENLRPVHEVFVCEMGARNVGDIREICELVHPQMGIITAIGPQHLESFKSLANVVKTKFELADALPPNGVFFGNMDSEEIRNRKVSVPTVGYGTLRGDYRAEDIRCDEHGLRFTVRGVEFQTKLLGRHNVQNLTGAIAVANTLGIPLEKLKLPVRQLEAVEHRQQLLGSGDRLVIDDAYNSNPAGALAALETLAMFEGLRILVTPGMVELGEKQRELNTELGRQAATRCDRAVLVGKKQAGPLREGLLAAGFPEEHIRVADTVEEAVAIADAFPAEGRRIILLENDLPDNYT